MGAGGKRPTKSNHMEHQPFQTIKIEDLVPSGTNPRKTFDEAKLAELAESIRTHGVLQPLLVRPRRVFHSDMAKALKMEDENVRGFEIVAGERRYRAAIQAGLIELPCVFRDLDDRAALECQVIENLQRDDLDPVEEAEGYEVLMRQHGYTIEQLQEKLGKSRSYVYGRLKLTALPAIAREALRAGTINASVALLIARVPNPKDREKATKEIIGGENEWDQTMSFREAKNHIEDEYMVRLKDCGFATTDELLDSKAGSCDDCPKRTGNMQKDFPDITSTDVCTDPLCFKRKQGLEWERVKAQAAARGKKTLEGNAADNAGYYSSGYVRLTDCNYADPKTRTWQALLGKECPEVTVARRTDGSITRLVSREDAEQVLAGKYQWAKDEPSSSNGEWAQKQKAREASEKFHKAVYQRALPQVLEGAKNLQPTDSLWRMIAGMLIERIGSDGARRLLKRREIQKSKEDNGDYCHQTTLLKKYSASLSTGELLVLIIEMIATWGDGWSWYPEPGEYQENFLQACGITGVDLSAIEREVKAEQKAKAEKKAGKGKGEVAA